MSCDRLKDTALGIYFSGHLLFSLTRVALGFQIQRRRPSKGPGYVRRCILGDVFFVSRRTPLYQ